MPYTKSTQIWYCPSDKAYSPNAMNIAHGAQSYHWFPNWVYNHPDAAAAFGNPNGPMLERPSAKVDLTSQRTLLTERGVFGWDGPDTECCPDRKGNVNHAMGYNILYFDGHVKNRTYGRKRSTLPASHWPPGPAAP